jgi:hypothetical protein
MRLAVCEGTSVVWRNDEELTASGAPVGRPATAFAGAFGENDGYEDQAWDPSVQ